jgi:hypothetical protein
LAARLSVVPSVGLHAALGAVVPPGVGGLPARAAAGLVAALDALLGVSHLALSNLVLSPSGAPQRRHAARVIYPIVTPVRRELEKKKTYGLSVYGLYI